MCYHEGSDASDVLLRRQQRHQNIDLLSLEKYKTAQREAGLILTNGTTTQITAELETLKTRCPGLQLETRCDLKEFKTSFMSIKPV